LAYFEANKNKLSVVAVANNKGEYVAPTTATVLNKSYNPLGRPLYIYVKTASLKRPEVREFVRFTMRRPDLVTEAKYVPLSAFQQTKESKKLENAISALGN
jgi:phosphate transport system substrate-binding protein